MTPLDSISSIIRASAVIPHFEPALQIGDRRFATLGNNGNRLVVECVHLFAVAVLCGHTG